MYLSAMYEMVKNIKPQDIQLNFSLLKYYILQYFFQIIKCCKLCFIFNLEYLPVMIIWKNQGQNNQNSWLCYSRTILARGP